MAASGVDDETVRTEEGNVRDETKAAATTDALDKDVVTPHMMMIAVDW